MWVAGVGVIGTALIGATAGTAVNMAAQAMAGGNGAPGVYNEYAQGPNYQNNQEISNQWKNWLTDAESDPNYGAIAPDWNDVWQQTQEKVKEYYNGTAMTPGINDAIKGSFAQRGMGGQAGETFALAASNANQAKDLSNASIQQNISKQTFANQGKNDWLGSMSNFINGTNQGAGNWSGAIPYQTKDQSTANMLGAVGSGLASNITTGAMQQQQNNWMQNMLQQNYSGAAGGINGGNLAFAG